MLVAGITRTSRGASESTPAADWPKDRMDDTTRDGQPFLAWAEDLKWKEPPESVAILDVPFLTRDTINRCLSLQNQLDKLQLAVLNDKRFRIRVLGVRLTFPNTWPMNQRDLDFQRNAVKLVLAKWNELEWSNRHDVAYRILKALDAALQD